MSRTDLAVHRPAAAPVAVAVAPNAPNSTFVSERFMASHMIFVRMMPDAPTSAPLMMSTLLPSTNPVMDAASPENEFSSEITTGMSAPPMGITNSTPMTSAAT
jgi:hypothetical protein